METVTVNNLLNCQDYTMIWISWENWTVRVGRGSVIGSSAFIWVWERGIHHYVKSISLATSGVTGHWKFSQTDGEFTGATKFMGLS